MTRFEFEFPTEWSLCPDMNQGERQPPTLERNAKDQERQTVEPRVEPRVLAAGGFGSSSR